MHRIIVRRWQSPVGEMLIGSIGEELCLSDWACNPRRKAIDTRLCTVLESRLEFGTSPTIEQAINELTEYFSGTRKEFDIPVRITGTDFQRAVRTGLILIPYGQTITYSQLASLAGNPKSVRAVGNAVATNPLSIFIPCHRVTGTGGALTGYAGGIHVKKYLLTLEQRFG